MSQRQPQSQQNSSQNLKIPQLNLKQEYNKFKQNQLLSQPNSSRSARTQRTFNRYGSNTKRSHKYTKSSSQATFNYNNLQRPNNDIPMQISKPFAQSFNQQNASLDGDQSSILVMQLQEKDKQIEKLNSQLRVTSNKLNMKEIESVFDIDMEKSSQEQIKYLKQVLVEIINKEKAFYFLLKQRCGDLSNFIQLFQGEDIINFDNQRDYTKFKEQIEVLLQSLQDSAKTEIDLGAKVRECERLNIEVSIQKNKGKNLQDKNSELQKIIDIIQNQNRSLTEENNSLQRLLNIEKKTAENNQRKVTQLEKRIEFILENDINTQLNPNDKLRNSLNELLRENESLKRDLTHKNQEIERQQGTIKKLNSFIQRLNKKIDSIKKQPGGGNNEQQNNQVIKSSADETSKFYKKDDIDLLSNYIIPDNLDYRIISLKSEYMNVLSDVVEIGPLGFSNHVIKQKDQTDQKEMVCLVTNQFLSYKEISEKLNYMIRNIQSIYDLSEMRDIIYSINGKFNTVFNANRMNLWVVDRQTGLLFTYNDIGIKKCVMNKGIIGEVFYYKQALNIKNAKAKALLYTISEQSYKEEPDFVETTLLLPIFVHKGNIKAVIEISNSQNDLFSFDEEYLGIVLAKYVGMCLQHFIERQVMQIEIKYKNLMFNAFEELSLCQHRFEYSKLIESWMKVLFGINQTIFYFIEDNQLTQYDQFNNKTQFSLDYGLVGLVAQQQKGLIINDIKYSSVYNKLVDIKTIMPLYAVPLIEKYDIESKTLGVMEICLKSQFKSKFERDQLIDPEEGLLGVEEPIANVIQSFLKLVGLSLRHNKFKEKEEILQQQNQQKKQGKK